METSVAISAPPPMEGPSHTPIPRATPIISKDAPVLTPIAPPPCEEVVETKTVAHKELDMSCSGEEAMEVLSPEEPQKQASAMEFSDGTSSGGSPSGESTSSPQQPSAISTSAASTSSHPTTATTTPGMVTPIGAHPHQQHHSRHYHQHHHHHSGCCPGHMKPHRSVSRSVQTDPEPSHGSTTPPSKEAARKETREASRHRKDGKVVSRREIKLPDSGISMKRKAVMEAISEILKKMYANTEKGRLPGSFKGRFSSEFTCDSDMREILHSKTTMTSYGAESSDGHDKAGSGEARNSGGQGNDASGLSKAKLEECQQLKDKVASLKWQMQHKRALKMARRKGERSPCGWMEALNCDMPTSEPKTIERSGFCGMKRGFLLTK